MTEQATRRDLRVQTDWARSSEGITAYHSRYWAELLTLDRPDEEVESLARSISNSRLDLNPHQIEAALFALRSPLSKGVILADEVGLGKTIEAGLVIAQRWAERKRRILLIVPASLRTQWVHELESKFFIPARVLESTSYRVAKNSDQANPFDRKDEVIVCSYHFASARQEDIQVIPWDLVVIDEAHRLRNVYKPATIMAKRIKEAVAASPKLLLTATPLQNSLMELYGLVSVIDEHVFGDADSFKNQFTRPLMSEAERNEDLRNRLAAISSRTLRKQVVEYIPFTARIAITQDFTPTPEEQQLYDLVSAYLQRDVLCAIPASNRALVTLVLRKLLASSTCAIAATLHGMADRLEGVVDGDAIDQEDFDSLEELRDEWASELASAATHAQASTTSDDPGSNTLPDPASELSELRSYAVLAESITKNAKGEALIPALEAALDKAETLGASRKALIFTESRRTQKYLFDLLSSNGYDGQIATISGTNSDPESRRIYEEWKQRHEGTSVITGTRAVDIKTAIMEHFKRAATILIGTEAAAEGVNLQFCSLVVNYDLPWNPQRVEQRIGRCHRYGQKHDVVVLNFVNQANAADRRVFQLLSEKFHLFDGVFGASDEILGTLESGVDFERRVAQIYQTCRDTEQIEHAFNELQRELDEEIQGRLAETRQALLDNFDEYVSRRLKVSHDRAIESLNDRQLWLLSLTRFELGERARFSAEEPAFILDERRSFHLDWRVAEATDRIFYRQDHPLAQELLEQATVRDLPVVEIDFDYTHHTGVLSAIEPFVGQSGWLDVSKLAVESLAYDEYLLLSGATDDGEMLPSEVCARLFGIEALAREASGAMPPSELLQSIRDQLQSDVLLATERRNALFFDEEVVKLDRWAEDLKTGLERELRDLDKEIREAQRNARLALQLSEKLEAQRHVRELEQRRSRKRRELYDGQDQIDAQRDELIQDMEKQLNTEHRVESVFTIRWTVS